MVNSEEGTPMGVGIWYEMQVSDPVAYLFRNANPEGPCRPMWPAPPSRP